MSNSVRPHRQQPTRLPSLGFSRQEHWSGLPFPSQCMKVKSESEVAQLCPTLRDPMDCSLTGSSIHGIFQVRVLEWGAITFFEETPEATFIHSSAETRVRYAHTGLVEKCFPGHTVSPLLCLKSACVLHLPACSGPAFLRPLGVHTWVLRGSSGHDEPCP